MHIVPRQGATPTHASEPPLRTLEHLANGQETPSEHLAAAADALVAEGCSYKGAVRVLDACAKHGHLVKGANA